MPCCGPKNRTSAHRHSVFAHHRVDEVGISDALEGERLPLLLRRRVVLVHSLYRELRLRESMPARYYHDVRTGD